MKNKIPHCRQKQFQNQIRKSLNRGKIDTPNTQIHDRSLPWLSTGTSIKKSGGVKLELWTQHPLLCGHASVFHMRVNIVLKWLIMLSVRNGCIVLN